MSDNNRTTNELLRLENNIEAIDKLIADYQTKNHLSNMDTLIAQLVITIKELDQVLSCMLKVNESNISKLQLATVIQGLKTTLKRLCYTNELLRKQPS